MDFFKTSRLYIIYLWTSITNIPGDFGGRGIAITPDGSKVYVADYFSFCFGGVCYNANEVFVYSATGSLITSIIVGEGPYGVAITPDGTRVYVTNADSNSVSVIDTSTDTVIATVPPAAPPAGTGPLTGPNMLIPTPPAKTKPVITWSTPADITWPTALGPAQLNATASVAGTFVYTPPAGTVLEPGVQTLLVVFTPVDTIHYRSASATVFITVKQATPVINWPTPAAIMYPAPLTSTQLNATASVPGTFVYSPPAGTVLGVGTHVLHVTFTPADLKHYVETYASVVINVHFQGSLSLTSGQTVTFSNDKFTGNVTLGNGSTLVLNNSQESGNVRVNGGKLVLNGSTVTNNVNVLGGSVIAYRGAIGNNLQISGASTFTLNSVSIGNNLDIEGIPPGSSQNQICSVRVDNNLTVQNNGVAVTIGSGTSSCPGNTVGNNLAVNNNSAPIAVFRNIVKAILGCSGNSSIAGGANAAKSKQGQCAHF
jgi:YVTN family beta-propeller protein